MLRLGKSLNYQFLESWEKNLFKFAFYVFLSFNLDFLWVNCLSLSKLILNSFGLNQFRLKLYTTAKSQSTSKHLVKHAWRLDEHSAFQVIPRTLELSGDRNTFVLETHTFQSKHKALVMCGFKTLDAHKAWSLLLKRTSYSRLPPPACHQLAETTSRLLQSPNRHLCLFQLQQQLRGLQT